jgi:trafficking protein particle complex subunit 10
VWTQARRLCRKGTLPTPALFYCPHFSFKDGATHTVPITLIALHHGEISLPKIDVKALPVDGEATMRPMALPSTETYQLHGAERVLVLPRGGRSTFALTMQESPNVVQV